MGLDTDVLGAPYTAETIGFPPVASAAAQDVSDLAVQDPRSTTSSASSSRRQLPV
jgi:hypothetical protein